MALVLLSCYYLSGATVLACHVKCGKWNCPRLENQMCDILSCSSKVRCSTFCRHLSSNCQKQHGCQQYEKRLLSNNKPTGNVGCPSCCRGDQERSVGQSGVRRLMKKVILKPPGCSNSVILEAEQFCQLLHWKWWLLLVSKAETTSIALSWL